MSKFSNVRRFGYRADGYVFLEFDTFEARADFLCIVPDGSMYGNTRYNTDGPPWRLTWKLSDFEVGFVIQEVRHAYPTPEPNQCP